MRARQFIIEYDQSRTIANFGQKIVNVVNAEKPSMVRFRQDPTNIEYIAQQVLGLLEKADPTPHKEYVQWLAKIYASGTAKLEDLISRGADALKRFNQLKVKRQLAPEHKDINRFRNFQQFEQVVASYPDVEQQQVDKGQAKEVYKDNAVRVIVPLDQPAACYYGQGTKWCTAAKQNNMFGHYNKQGALYIIIPAQPSYNGEKYQFHFQTRSFMNEQDNPINPADVIQRFPQLKKLFSAEATNAGAVGFFVSEERFSEDWFDSGFQDSMYDALVRNIRATTGRVKSAIHSELSHYGALAPNLTRIIVNGLTEDATGLASMFVANLEPAMLMTFSEDDEFDLQNYITDWINDSLEIDWEELGERYNADAMEIAYGTNYAIWKTAIRPVFVQELKDYCREMSEL